MNKVKPLNLRETTLKEEMKSRCLQKGQYVDKNAKEKFDMLCHLEDFEVQYFELLSQVEKLTQENNDMKERIGYLERSNNRKEETIIDLRMEQELDKYKSVIDKAIKLIKECTSSPDKYENFIDYYETKSLLEILRSKE